MKHLRIFRQFVLILLLFTACAPPTDDPGDPDDPGVVKEVAYFDLTPHSVDLHPIAIQFLIDNSTSVDSECKGMGQSRYDFVNFIFNVFRISPELSWENLYVGASSFGNENENYKRLIDIQHFSSAFQTVNEPSKDKLGTSQSFSEAIQKSIDDLYMSPVEKRYLVVVTDGKFSSELPEQVKAVMQRVSGDANFYMFTSLFCSDFASGWNNINNVEVFNSLDNSAVRLFRDLNGHLPANSLLISPENIQTQVVVKGFYTSSSFLFWNGYDQQKVKIADPIISDFWEIETGGKKDLVMLPVSKGCPDRIFTLIDPLPAGNWLLFVKRGTFQGFNVSVTSSEQKVEIVNDIPTNFHFKVTSKDGTDLRKWEDCFSGQITWTLSDGFGNGIVTNGNSCTDIQHICLRSEDGSDEFLYSEVNWTPKLPTIGKVNLTLNLDAKSGEDDGFTGWQGSLPPFDVKIKPIYRGHSTSILGEGYIQIEFIFENVISPDSVVLYLASSIDTQTFKKNSCPFPINIEADPKVYEFNAALQCVGSNPGKDSVCTSGPKQDEFDVFKYVYTFVLHSNVITNCYDQLYFDWQSDNNQKDTLWRCDHLYDAVTCYEQNVKPGFLP